jgi:hypothetical protein
MFLFVIINTIFILVYHTLALKKPTIFVLYAKNMDLMVADFGVFQLNNSPPRLPNNAKIPIYK